MVTSEVDMLKYFIILETVGAWIETQAGKILWILCSVILLVELPPVARRSYPVQLL